ncbi:centrosomal protein of 112 kDa-like isoform X2 [Pecten maximus]|uniref:centrosomal protein of 112 kDa-like isoform X1 n=1 Tax=Pecten maximus TaxID=6579 RepID=UPI0014580017|nr:centrosomal protein of 112 kDa-like isoform X1 [Pecten maximus]XP_033734023.1 centrosomal protein of 112 kDa-like isoform X2 [Pecten maximus]XP_033734024.1 centrosomal protein of 112 kDa-like isoform X2 [Pecten maximus]
MTASMSSDPVYLGLDQKFDKVLADMKPHVLKLPHKTDRQKCAIWIKKLCEPVMGITGRKNRNAYAQLMLHMLKRGVLEGPFTSKPQDGPLPTLPPYMSIYFDEPSGKKGQADDKVPDWVAGELTSSVGSSLFKGSIGNPTASSTFRSGISPIGHERGLRRRPHTSMGIELDKDPSIASPIRGMTSPMRVTTSPVRGLELPDHGLMSFDDISIGRKSPTIKKPHFLSDDEESLRLVRHDERKLFKESPKHKWKKEEELSQPSPPHHYNPPSGLFGGSIASTKLTFDIDQTKDYGKDNLQMKTKMLEARFHEEKLRLQQKHDAAVQKILDRKNAEIEELKSHYRSKAKELEETISKMEKKIQTLVKDSQAMRDTKDKHIMELKKMVEESNITRRNEFEKELNDMVAKFEQEKFDMQKHHTKNIQEILDDTNGRLLKMEKEYNQQTNSTSAVIKELENRLQMLMSEADQTAKARNVTERAKMDLDSKFDRLTADYRDIRDKYSNLEKEHQRSIEVNDQEIRTLKNKMEASLEFMKQEHNIASAKAADNISELDNHVDQLKRALKDAEEQRQRQIREMEQVQQQDKIHLENLHDKQTRSMKLESEQMEQDFQKKIKKMDQTIREKDDEIKKLTDKNTQQSQQAEKALEEFKGQVEKNQDRMYNEMKQQMERVETDLNKSKQARERQAREFNKQLEDERAQHERQMVELKLTLEHDKAQMLQDFHKQKEMVLSQHEKDFQDLKENHQSELYDLDTRMRERTDRDAKKISSVERQNQELREEIVQANQLRKQQLVELGLLREEEKQKMQREQESELARLRSEMEQQRLDLQKTHSTEMEKMLEKTNGRLKDIEKEYMQRGQKATETIAELQATCNHLREEIKRIQDGSEKKIHDTNNKYKEETKYIKRQYSNNVENLQTELESQEAWAKAWSWSLQKEVEAQQNRVRTLERRLDQQESDFEEKMTQLKLAYEEKMRGMMSLSVRQELEDTIDSLKSQVNSLQQRSLILQEEIDLKNQYTLSQFQASSPIKAV